MDQGFRIPNLGNIAVVGKTDTRMNSIINSLNESVKDPKTNNKVTCSRCGAIFTYDNTNNDGSHPTCPTCNFEVDTQAYNNNLVQQESELSESLEETLDEYIVLVECEMYEDAKDLLESVEAVAISDDEGIMLEKVKTIVHADGKIEKKKIKTKKKKLKGKRLAAARKNAKKMAKNPNTKKARAKAMKKRAKKFKSKKNEMLQSYSMTESIMNLLESEGISTVDRSSVSRLINESKPRITGQKNNSLSDETVSALENVLNNKGLEVLDMDIEEQDGVIAVEVIVQDTDSEVFLGEISDEIAEVTDCEVDYDEPEADEDDPSEVDLVFYLIPRSTITESTLLECENSDKKDNKDEKDEEEGKENKKTTKNESLYVGGMLLNESFEAYAGGQDNVRCRLNPAFIRPGQVIYDADCRTVFKALTESVETGDDYALTIDVVNSEDGYLSEMFGAEVNLTSDGNYFLLKSNPVD